MLLSYLKLALKVFERRRVFTAISLFGISFTLLVLVVALAAQRRFWLALGGGFLASLPLGLVLSDGGVLSGTLAAVGSFSFTIRAADTNGCWGTNAYTLVIGCPAITVGPATLSSGIVGTGYSQSLTAGGGLGPYTFAVTTGTLPNVYSAAPGSPQTLASRAGSASSGSSH